MKKLAGLLLLLGFCSFSFYEVKDSALALALSKKWELADRVGELEEENEELKEKLATIRDSLVSKENVEADGVDPDENETPTE